MYGTTGHLAVGARRQRYSFTRVTALGEHPRQHLASWSGILQADAYGGYGKLYDAERGPAPILEASCWAHARHKFYELAVSRRQRAARRNVMHRRRSRRSRWKRCSASTLCSISSAASTVCRPISGSPCARSKARLLVAALEAWMREERRKLSCRSDVAGAIDYILKRSASFNRFLEDGCICLTNNAAERALRGLALGRKAWLFAGFDRGGQRAALCTA